MLLSLNKVATITTTTWAKYNVHIRRANPYTCGFDSSVWRALYRHRGGRWFESRSEPELFSDLCSSSVTAALALMTVKIKIDQEILLNHFK